MLTAAPGWLQFGYATHGQSLAAWLRFRPVAKSVVRAAMDLAVEGF
jgi:ABC-type sulfate transport system substrate-binding protein